MEKKNTIEALMEQGKANGRLTTKEITDALEEKEREEFTRLKVIKRMKSGH